MNKDEQEYINELKNEITDLENQVKNLTEEKQQAVALASKYMDENSNRFWSWSWSR